MADLRKTLLVVVGPTAVGKTAASIELARHFKTEVISADARQIFQEMQIGTARPTEQEMGEVPHHFIGSHSVQEQYSVGDFETDALNLLTQLFRKHDALVLAGGSGLYVNALCNGLDAMPEADLAVREQLQEQLEQQGLAALVNQLTELDPAFAAQIDAQNPQRVLRALEVCIATGKPYSSFRTGKKAERPFSVVKIGLNRDREELYNRINQRVDAMLAQGLLEEVKRLYPYRNLNALQTVGYSELFDFLEGKYDRDEAVRLLKRNSRRYAKRQLTWFNRDPEITWFHPNELAKIIAFAEQKVAES